MQLILFQPGELPQAHIHDGSCLNISKPEPLHQPFTRNVSILRGPDDSYYLINIVTGNDQTFKYMSSLLSLVKIIFRPANNDIMPVTHEIAYYLLQGKGPGTALDKRYVIDIE
ncbi:MAG: hypothetical protein BWY95_01698 [Bacteroidetes bacterium ADurb.BinA104]|nr:MAG: hypothetical protein BWY95_01698 [Bacteroidetes bacterium ADurb.BinA104]